MNKKIVYLILSCLIVSALALGSCGGEEEEVTVPTEEEEVTIPTEEEEEAVTPGGGNWWDKFGEPQYGGTFTFRLSADFRCFDPWKGSVHEFDLWMEPLFQQDWTLDRSIWSYKGIWVPPERVIGCIAESWERPDNSIVIVHVRQGVNWQDKPPMNGRELTAYDVEWSWHRLTGMGSGFTEHSPYIWMGNYTILESVTATDKYTLVFKSTEPSLQLFQSVIETYNNQVQPREVIEKYGDLDDWKNACGTGPFILDDYVNGTSATFRKNPNYWGYDERHPQNHVPYVDGLKILIIPEDSTAFAALRTGKIDFEGGIPWEQAQKLQETNPELQSTSFLLRSEAAQPVVTNKPFNDIRVRKAMDMALDRESIAKTYYGGLVKGTAYGINSPLLGPDLYNPFEEWPKELQEEYTYNPEGARQLLTEAGYPDGFSTSIMVSSAANTDLVLVVQSYFADIGIDMEIEVFEATVFNSYIRDRKVDQIFWGVGCCTPNDPGPRLDYFTPENFRNAQYAYDDHTIDLLHRAATSLDLDESYRLWKELDMYVMEQHWFTCLPPTVEYTMWHPWLKGYSGESMSRFQGQQYARWWIDR